MAWNYVYTPYLWPSAGMVLLLVALAIYSWCRRSVPGAIWLMTVCMIGTIWAICWVMEVAAADLTTKITCVKIQGALNLPIVTVITCFFLEYAWPGRWLTRRNLILLTLPCLFILGLVLTNNFYHLLWRGFVYEGKTIPLRSPINWFCIAYGIVGLGILNLVVFVWLFRRSPQHRWPVALMLIGQIAGRVAYFLDAARILQSALPINVMGMDFEFIMYAITLFGFSIFDPIPLARQTALKQLRDGMLVLDPEGQVVNVNPAAQVILELPERSARGQPIWELLTAYPVPQDDGVGEMEICLGEGQGDGQKKTFYLVETSPLKDWRGVTVGYLVLLHDITAQKWAQAQVLEQQRALVMFSERERLARELHDSIGQVLGYAGLQVDASRKLIEDGQVASADHQLERVGSILREAHADVRECILNLRAAPSEQQPFFAALRHYLDGYTQNYGIQADLIIGPGIDESFFVPGMQMQLFRVLQEALSNVRKHAKAKCARVAFAHDDGEVQLFIEDDGGGFDPTRAAGASHLGLRFMRERIEELGGSIEIQSAPGKGTCILVALPAVARQEDGTNIRKGHERTDC